MLGGFTYKNMFGYSKSKSKTKSKRSKRSKRSKSRITSKVKAEIIAKKKSFYDF